MSGYIYPIRIGGILHHHAAPFAYIPNSGSNTVTVIDTVTTPPSVVATVPVGTNPRGVASVVKTSETFTYVTNFGSENVSVIRTFNDPLTDKVVFEKVRDIRVGRNPYGIAVDPAGTFAYVTNFTDGTVSKIDLGTNTVAATITVGSNPIGIVVTPDGSKVYAVNNSSGTVSVINAADDTHHHYGHRWASIPSVSPSIPRVPSSTSQIPAGIPFPS